MRQASAFHNRVTADGSSGFTAEAGRYHLYVSYACPWAHRTIIFRRLKGLEECIGMTVVDPIRDQRGWAFTGAAGSELDRLNGFDFLSEAYLASNPGFDGRVTVPVLWDHQERMIVNNESSEIIRLLNSEFDAWGNAEADYYPAELRAKIDAITELIYPNINDGVYRCGFATSQAAYDDAIAALFATLDQLEERLAGHRYLVDDTITEADWRLFTTLVRFDPVYVTHFKCNVRRLIDYPNLWGYTRDLYQQPGIADTVNLDHIRRHYYVTHRSINPHGIIPAGPEINYSTPHGRA